MHCGKRLNKQEEIIVTSNNNPKPDSVAIFWNNPAEGSNQPHFKGYVTVDGREYEFGAWPAKSGKEGAYSGPLKPKGQRG